MRSEKTKDFSYAKILPVGNTGDFYAVREAGL